MGLLLKKYKAPFVIIDLFDFIRLAARLRFLDSTNLLLFMICVNYGRFGISERQWVEAQVENAKQQAILMTLKSQVSSDEAYIRLDLHSLR